jgi:hypothetical protein
MSGRVDLDAVAARADAALRSYERPMSLAVMGPLWLASAEDVPGLVAELRFLRPVIDALPRRPCLFCGYGDHEPLCPLGAYDQHVQPPPGTTTAAGP